jgi:hypothetical protein
VEGGSENYKSFNQIFHLNILGGKERIEIGHGETETRNVMGKAQKFEEK